MIRTTALVIGFLGMVFVGVGLVLPSEFNVSRSIEINADQKTIHHYVGELKNWDLWTPWKELDPGMVVTMGERTSGVGASQSWTGKNGEGALTVTMSSPDKGLSYDLLFGKEADNCESVVSYSPVNEKTRVTWSMQGEMTMPVIGGYWATVMGSTTGDMFEKGLKKLKNVAENAVSGS